MIKSQVSFVWVQIDSDGMICEGGRVGYQNIQQEARHALLSLDMPESAEYLV